MQKSPTCIFYCRLFYKFSPELNLLILGIRLSLVFLLCSDGVTQLPGTKSAVSQRQEGAAGFRGEFYDHPGQTAANPRRDIATNQRGLSTRQQTVHTMPVSSSLLSKLICRGNLFTDEKFREFQGLGTIHESLLLKLVAMPTNGRFR